MKNKALFPNESKNNNKNNNNNNKSNKKQQQQKTKNNTRRHSIYESLKSVPLIQIVDQVDVVFVWHLRTTVEFLLFTNVLKPHFVSDCGIC